MGLFLILLVLLFFFYFFIGSMLSDSGLYSESEMFYGSKSKLLVEGPEPVINNYDFNVPPLQMLLYSIFEYNFVIASSIMGSFFSSFLLIFIFTYFKKTYLKILFSISALTMPGFLFSALETSPYMLFLFFYCLGFYFLLEFSIRNRVFYLFVFGLLYGILFLVKFEIIWTSIYVIISFYAIYHRERNFLYYSTAALFPMFFLFFGWLFVYWIFRGNPSEFIMNVFIIPLQNGVSEYGKNFLSSLITSSLYIVFYFIVLFKIGKFRIFFVSPAFMVFISPFFLSILMKLFGAEITGISYNIIYLINFIILLPYIGPLLNVERRRMFLATFVILAYVFDVFMFANFGNREERHFLGALNNKKFHYDIAEYRAVSEFLDKYESVIIDAEKSYKIVFFSNNPDKILYKNMPEYYTAIVTPYMFAEALIVNKEGDSITENYPYILEDGLNGFFKAYETENYLVLEREKTGP